MSPSLIIFDCDGVLVDTEHITGAFFRRYLLAQGIPDPEGEALYRYRGFSLAGAIKDLEKRTNTKVPETFMESFRSETMAVMANEVQAIEGVASALELLSERKCVASNGPKNKMQLTLGATGLAHHFGDSLFSAYEIKKWKPDPGLFLHAAARMGVTASGCVVVEDSLHGVHAARAAGMRALAFAPKSQAQQFREAGAETFSDMSDLPAILS